VRSAFRSLLLLGSLGPTLTFAQTNNLPKVQHVIVVIQENRTPDNLFGSDFYNPQGRQLPLADLVSQGSCHGSGADGTTMSSPGTATRPGARDTPAARASGMFTASASPCW